MKRNVKATKITPFFTGAIGLLGVWAVEEFTRGLGVADRNTVFLVVAFATFLVPAYVFVLGIDTWRTWTLADMLLMTANGRAVALRFAMWFIGGAVMLTLIWLFSGLRS